MKNRMNAEMFHAAATKFKPKYICFEEPTWNEKMKTIDISEDMDGSVHAIKHYGTMYVCTNFYAEDIDIIEPVIAPENCQYLFGAKRNGDKAATGFENHAWVFDVEEIILTNLDTSGVKDMSHMFECFGMMAPKVIIDGLDKIDVSKVFDMSYMFCTTGYNANACVQIANIHEMFQNAINVRKMDYMFSEFGDDAPEVYINILSAKMPYLESAERMFERAGARSQRMSISIVYWDTPKLENAEFMFADAALLAASAHLTIEHWNHSKKVDPFPHLFGEAASQLNIRLVRK